MERKNKVVKFKRRKSINIGTILFFIVFVYIAANIYMYLTTDHLSTYEVQAGTSADDSVAQGVIVRKEKMIYTDTAGYISYYMKDGERVSRKSTLYSIDESKQVYELLTNNSENFGYTSKDLNSIQKDVIKFIGKYSDDDYSTVTNFMYDMENTLTEIMLEHTMDSIQDIMSENGIVSNFKIVASDVSGIITYHYDGYENLKAKDVTSQTFEEANYKTVQTRSSDLVAVDEPICKIVTSEDWSIVLLLSQTQYEKLSDRRSVKITITDDDFTCIVPVEAYESNGEYFARLDFNKYMIRYIDDRFLSVELHLNLAEGLKIPRTAVTQKNFYMVPLTMFTYGADSKNLGLTKESYNANGEVEYLFVETKIYYKDDTYAYISTDLFEYGNWVRSAQTQERYQISDTVSLNGVYNVNNGYFVFERVDILYENDEFYIVSDKADSSIGLYDQIALDVKYVTDDALIY